MTVFSLLRSKLTKCLLLPMENHERCKKCNIKCGLIRVSPEILRILEDGFQKLSESDSKSLLKKYLTKQVFDQLKQKKTSFGSSLLDCVQSGNYPKYIPQIFRIHVLLYEVRKSFFLIDVILELIVGKAACY